jgi:hypothetical protein
MYHWSAEWGLEIGETTIDNGTTNNGTMVDDGPIDAAFRQSKIVGFPAFVTNQSILILNNFW